MELCTRLTCVCGCLFLIFGTGDDALYLNIKFVEINTVLNILFLCEPSDFQFPGSASVGLRWVGPRNLHSYQDACLGKHILISAQGSRLLRSLMSEMKFCYDYKPSNIV